MRVRMAVALVACVLGAASVFASPAGAGHAPAGQVPHGFGTAAEVPWGSVGGGWLLVVGTIPAGLLGLLFQDSLRSVFASAQSAAFFLMLNGVMLYGAERLRRRAPVHEEGGDPDAGAPPRRA